MTQLKKYRIDVHVRYQSKIEGVQGFLQVFGVTSTNLKDAYEVDFEKFAIGLKIISDPLVEGIWFSSRINYQRD